ncbi:hypothetical protein L0F63_003202 [Massospora cicadina]|nr:hypothetical protein L0F63_003202 [Massospora cicadina]
MTPIQFAKFELGPEMEDTETYSRSCDYCRAMKIRCTRKKPACLRCSKKGISCTRNNPFHKRGPKPKPYPALALSHRRQIRAKSEVDVPTACSPSIPPQLVPVISQPFLFQCLYASTNLSPDDPLYRLIDTMGWVARYHHHLGPERFHLAWQFHIAHQDLDCYFNSTIDYNAKSSFDVTCFTRANNLLLSFALSLQNFNYHQEFPMTFN